MVGQKICICLKLYDYEVIDMFVCKIVDIVICVGVIVVGFVFFLIEKNVVCVIWLLYKYKDSCEYFEMCIYKCLIDIVDLMFKVVDLLMCFDLFVDVNIEIKF